MHVVFNQCDIITVDIRYGFFPIKFVFRRFFLHRQRIQSARNNETWKQIINKLIPCYAQSIQKFHRILSFWLFKQHFKRFCGFWRCRRHLPREMPQVSVVCAKRNDGTRIWSEIVYIFNKKLVKSFSHYIIHIQNV
jgi:hypothetical protein